MKRTLLAKVQSRAQGRCEYCQMPDAFDRAPFQVDHIVAQQHGGETALENLAWTCLHCNKHKGPNIAGIDPVSGQLVALFHPRRHQWDRHFRWDNALLIGRTRGARATIRVLALNDPDLVAFRSELMEEGVF